MSIPLFIPPPSYTARVVLRRPSTLRKLIEQAGLYCKASGRWTERPVETVKGDAFALQCEPGDWGAVKVIIPRGLNRLQGARLAVAALAYSLHDVVAKESIKGAEWKALAPKRGRPRSGKAISNKERQRLFRERRRKVVLR